MKQALAACALATILAHGLVGGSTGVLADIPCNGPVNVTSSPDDRQTEVAISADPTDPNNIVIALIEPSSTTRKIRAYSSNDGGLTWRRSTLPPVPSNSALTPWSDPSVAHDLQGNAYIAYMARTGSRQCADDGTLDPVNQHSVMVAKSADAGASWQSTTPAGVTSVTARCHDKEFLEVDDDPASPGSGNLYLVWTDTTPATNLHQIAASNDGGSTWQIQNLDSGGFFLDLATGTEGEVYAVWYRTSQDQIRFENCGVTATSCNTAPVVTVAQTGDFDGGLNIPPHPQHGGVWPVPSIDSDRSAGPGRGRLWVAYADFVNSADPNDMDVFVTWSDNQGITGSWSPPVNIGRSGSAQFHPWLDVDDADGSVGVVYYSAENDPNNQAVDVYYAQFSDGDPHSPGSWIRRRVSHVPSAPYADDNHPFLNPAEDYREYIGLHEQHNTAHLAWTSLHTGDAEVFYNQVSGYLTQIHSGETDEDADRFGTSVVVGDFDDDGREDLAVGVPGEDSPGTSDHGQVIVYYSGVMRGSRSPQRLDQSQAGATPEAGDALGSALASGDFNGDGIQDLAIGAPGRLVNGAAGAGMVVVFPGASDGLTSAGAWVLTQSTFGLSGSVAGDAFGVPLAAGDFNGDGRDDLAIGAVGEDLPGGTDAGAVTVAYGSGSGLKTSGAQLWTQVPAADANDPGDGMGKALAVGDFNGDARDDLAVGVPGEDTVSGGTDCGQVLIYYGSGNGLTGTGAGRFNESQAGGSPESGDQFGAALAAGDFDADGKDDLAMGIPGEDLEAGGLMNAGRVAVFHGSGSGLEATGALLWDEDVLSGVAPQTGAAFGSSLAVGDFDGNGSDDLAVGVPDKGQGPVCSSDHSRGEVSILYSAPALGLSPAVVNGPLQQPGALGVNECLDHFGDSLAAGDFNRDCRADLAVGTPNEDVHDAIDSGAVYPFRGAAGGLQANPVERSCLDRNCDGILDSVPGPEGTPRLTWRSTDRFSWSPLCGCTGYDVVRGSLGVLSSSEGNFASSTQECAADDLDAVSLTWAANPALGQGFWFLVRGSNCGGNGTYDSGASSQVGTRDAEIQASSPACP